MSFNTEAHYNLLLDKISELQTIIGVPPNIATTDKQDIIIAAINTINADLSLLLTSINSHTSNTVINTGSINSNIDSTNLKLEDIKSILESTRDFLVNILKPVIDEILLRLKAKTDLIQEVKLTGSFNGKVAKLFHVLGRRTGFTSTTNFNDVGESIGANSIALFADMVGTEVLTLVSSSAFDTALGTGVRSVRVTYIDNNDDLVQSAPIATNGGTVALGFVAKAILWLEAETVGANNVAVGNISLLANGVHIMRITAGGNRSLDAYFMIPKNYTGYIVDWETSCISNSQDVRLRATVNTFDNTLTAGVYKFVDNNYVNVGGRTEEDMYYFILPPLARVKLSTITSSTSSGTRIEGGFTILLIAD